MLIFAHITSNHVKEKETQEQVDHYQKELDKNKAEIAMAVEIQKSFLPESLSAIPGFDVAMTTIPALDVDGDFYDFMHGDGRVGVVIADVSGKGIPAALFMARSKFVIQGPRRYLGKASPMFQGMPTTCS
jgi:sigma-B regulation protein RsbU (phosphoserine phosphatase)